MQNSANAKKQALSGSAFIHSRLSSSMRRAPEAKSAKRTSRFRGTRASFEWIGISKMACGYFASLLTSCFSERPISASRSFARPSTWAFTP